MYIDTFANLGGIWRSITNKPPKIFMKECTLHTAYCCILLCFCLHPKISNVNVDWSNKLATNCEMPRFRCTCVRYQRTVFYKTYCVHSAHSTCMTHYCVTYPAILALYWNMHGDGNHWRSLPLLIVNVHMPAYLAALRRIFRSHLLWTDVMVNTVHISEPFFSYSMASVQIKSLNDSISIENVYRSVVKIGAPLECRYWAQFAQY